MTEQRDGQLATEIGTIPAPDCRCVTFSPDGSALALVADGQLTFVEYPDRAVWSIPFGPPSDRPVQVTWGLGAEHLYVLGGGRLTAFEAGAGASSEVPGQIGEFGELAAVAVSPDGRFVAIGTSLGPVLVLDDWTRAVLVLHGTDPVTALSWRADGSELCVARGDVAEFWDVPDQAMLTSIHIPGYPVRQLTCSPDGRLLAAVTPSGVHEIRIGALNDRTVTGLWAGREPPVAARFSRDSSRLLIGVSNGGVVITGRDLQQVDSIPADIAFEGVLDVSRNGLLATRASPDEISLWELSDTVPGPGRAAAADRRWAARHGRTVGRQNPGMVGRSASSRSTVLPLSGTPPAFAWWPDGRSACGTTTPDTLARIRPPSAQPLWEWISADGAVSHVSVSAAGLVAVTGQNQVTVLNSEGQVVAVCDGGGRAAWSPTLSSPALSATSSAADPECVLAVAEPGARPQQILLHWPQDPRRPSQRLPMPDGVADLGWSTDGRLLAAAGRGHVVLWDAQTWRRDMRPLRAGMPGQLTGPLAWSPDRRRLAAVTTGERLSAVTIWNTRDWEIFWEIPDSDLRGEPLLAWSQDGRILALSGTDASRHHVELWDTVTQQRVMTFNAQGLGRISGLAWSPDGDSLAITHANGPVILWDVGDTPLPEADGISDLPFDWDLLTRLAGAAASAHAAVSLSTLAGLLALLGGDSPDDLVALAANRGLTSLRGLRWPMHARIGLAVLLAAGLPRHPAYVAPADATREDLVMALKRVLSGPAGPVNRPPVPVIELAGLLDQVDERLLTFLELLGPEAVAAEPTLPARLQHLRDELTPLTISQRRLLGMRVPLTGDGRSEGGTGGHGRAGVARHGKIDALLLSQLALPSMAFAIRHSRDELLYRTRDGSPPARPRAAVLVLDDTAAAHGQVGITLRLIAHLLARTMIKAGYRCALVTLGQPATDVILSRAEDVIRIWTAGTAAPPDADAALRLAEGLVSRLVATANGETRVIMLTHPFQPALPHPGSVTVRVYYPGRPVAVDDPGCVLVPPDPTAAELTSAVARLVN